MKILLLEDDAVLSDIILDYLRESWRVDYAYDADAVYALLEENTYDLFIFDINVVGQTGLELLEELRSFNNTTPAIFITAYRDTAYLKKAFDIGANDYIKKPFELEELTARIHNIKRLFNIDTDESITIDTNIVFYKKRKKIIKDTQEFSLTGKDTLLLSYFLNNKGRLLSNEELSQNIWDFDTQPSSATLRSHIRTLRELIGKDRITTVRGEGYIYE
jgi:DNA-binding response OmpR family regulator